MSQAPICVIIPAYNAAATIGRAIRSALAEPEVGAVVVVDDCSTDTTPAAALAADDGSGRLVVHSLSVNQGPSGARNAALAKSDLPLVALLDSDDFLVPGRFARLLGAAGGEWDFIADNMLFISQSDDLPAGIMEHEARAPVITRQLGLHEFVGGNIPRTLRPRAELGFVKPLFRRAALERLGLAYDPTLRLGEDYVLYCQALMRGARFMLASSCGYVAVERAKSLSGSHRTTDLVALARADRALIEEAQRSRVDAAGIALMRRHLGTLTVKIQIREALDQSHANGRWRTLAQLSLRPGRFARVVLGVLSDRIGGSVRQSRDVRKLMADDSFVAPPGGETVPAPSPQRV